ncbi:hypothetical protein [Dapis sp. BLCC M229]|uniref:hypothetical protein n=1 Tax=Dapis sp. BLCC M229 TaxID=3400188 RepID=UPI003CE9DCAA
MLKRDNIDKDDCLFTESLNTFLDFIEVDRVIEEAVKVTTKSPKALYLFMQRYISFDTY